MSLSTSGFEELDIFESEAKSESAGAETGSVVTTTAVAVEKRGDEVE